MSWIDLFKAYFFIGGEILEDVIYMEKALELAAKGRGYVNPNPPVGAVIVKNGRVISQGYHREYGALHAEREAILNCKEDMKGATIYVTLEPCCHYGKTPPCTEIIIESGISKVVMGALDPNPKVAGKGMEILKSHGIEVEVGLLKERCENMTKEFRKFIATKRPFVTMKYAMTMDGKIATKEGYSKWITGEKAREKVHQMRHFSMGIMVGVGTVIADDPMINCRMENVRNPIRIICDTNLRTPLNSQIVTTAKEIETIIATASEADEKIREYENLGCRILKVSKRDNHVDLNELMEKLGQLKIDSILLEGGGSLNYSALKSGIVDEAQTYIAPKIFGGTGAKTPVMGEGIVLPSEGFTLVPYKFSKVGDDFLIESEVKRCLQE